MKFAALTKNAPATMTNTTMATLMMVMTAETRDDRRVPNASSTVKMPTIRTGPQVNGIGPSWIVLGRLTPNTSNAVLR